MRTGLIYVSATGETEIQLKKMMKGVRECLKPFNFNYSVLLLGNLIL